MTWYFQDLKQGDFPIFQMDGTKSLQRLQVIAVKGAQYLTV